MTPTPSARTDARHAAGPDDGGYLRRVGERLRLKRASRGMSRKVLAQASGVSERYLADLESGTGNASLRVLRQLAGAMSLAVEDLVADRPERPVDLALAINQLERLSTADLAEARRLLGQTFGGVTRLGAKPGRIALIGLRGAGKTTLGRRAASTLGVPFVELDREIERASGMDLAEVFSLHGQAGFRKLEHHCLETIVAGHERVVIATGGSLVTEPATYDLLLSSCFVVWLKALPEQHMARVAAQGDTRPMAASRQAMDDLKAILESRAALYAKADAQVDTSAGGEDEAAAALIAAAGRHRAESSRGGTSGNASRAAV